MISARSQEVLWSSEKCFLANVSRGNILSTHVVSTLCVCVHFTSGVQSVHGVHVAVE